jgi:hypothetical protein
MAAKPGSVPQAAPMLLAMPLVALRSRRRLGFVVFVLVLHALVLTGLSRLGVWADRDRRAQSAGVRQAPLMWQLPAMPLGRLATPAAAPPSLSPKQTTTASKPRIAPAQSTPATTTLPTAAPTPVPLQTAEATPAEPQASAPPLLSSPRLNLVLPSFARAASAPWHRRPTPMDDPRANTPKATIESRLQAAMGGDGRWTEERIDNDHLRYRRGDRCVDVNRSRAEQLDPFQQGSNPKPWLVGPARPC